MASYGVSSSILDHGKVVKGKKSKVECGYCGKVVTGSTRLKYHLAGIRGDVIPCEQAPKSVREAFRSQLLEKMGKTRTSGLSREVIQLHQQDLLWKRDQFPYTNGTITKKIKCESAHCSGSESGKLTDTDSESENGANMLAVPPGKSVITQASSNGMESEDSFSRQAKKSIGRFFYETCTDFSAVSYPSFQNLIYGTSNNGWANCKIPSCQELKGWILQDEVNEMHDYVKKKRQSWTSTGCSVLLDGWVDGKGRNLVSFIVDSLQGPVYLQSLDISDCVDDVNALQSLLDGVIQDIGIENVVQIISFSTTGWAESVGKQFVDRHRSLFWTVNASHCIELMLQKIGMMDEIKQTMDKAKILSKFIHGHASMLKLLKEYTDGHVLIMPSKIRTAMPFMTLGNIVQEKEKLKAMFTSSAWNTSIWASRVKGKRVAELVGDHSFWKGADLAIKVTLPLVNVLSLINGAEPQVGFIYETMDQAKEAIKEELKSKKSQYMPYWELIDDIWNTHLHSPIHAAGYYLNPSLFYSTDFYSDPEVSFGLLCCIVRMVQNQHVQDTISLQLDAYRKSKGAFKEGSTTGQRTKFSPALWWSHYGAQYPELQQFATRILSQTCVGASKYRLNRSLAEKLLTKGMNPIEQQALSDLAFVHYNLQLKLQHSQLGTKYDLVAIEVDPMDDWIVDDTMDTGGANNDKRPSLV